MKVAYEEHLVSYIMSFKLLFEKYSSLPILSKYAIRFGLIGVLLSIVCLTVYFCLDYQRNWIDALLIFLGVCSFSYILSFLCFFFYQRIERDIIIARKSYWRYVLGFVLAVPFLCTAVLILFNISLDGIYQSDPEYLQHCKSCGTTHIVKETEHPHILWDVYYHFVDPGNQHDTTTGGKVYTAILAILGIFLFNGLLVTTIIGWVDQRKDKWQRGRIRYKLRHLPKGHYAVVIGANEITASIVKNLLRPKPAMPTPECVSDNENQYVILQTSSDVEKVRDVLSSHLTKQELAKVIIYNALRDSALEIALLHLECASEIYILGENTTIDGGETYHDAMNMRCLNLVAKYLKITREEAKTTYKRKVCHVMFDYQTTYSVFQFSDVSVDVKKTLVFLPFNRYESWARKALVDCVDYTPLDGKGIKYEDNERVHFVIVGMSKMGIAMGIQALLQLHFPNYVRDKALKSRITFIDTNADKEMLFFTGRYATLFELARHRYIDANECDHTEVNSDYGWIDPMQQPNCQWKHLSENGENFLDVEIEFIKGELESKGVRQYLKEISQNEPNSKLTIAICLTQTHQAVAAALYMPIEVYNCHYLQQILVYQREADDIVANLQYMNSLSIRYQKLHPFGMLYGEYMPDELYTLKAKLTNWAYHVIKNNKKWPSDLMQDVEIFEEIKDLWEKTKIAEQYANMNFVDTINQKLRSGLEALLATNVNSKSKDAFAESEHNRWNIDRLLLGYSPCGSKDDLQLRILQEQQKDTSIFKNELKASPARIHPNICDHKHLSEIDVEAYPYDKELNSYIPTILSLVSDR